MPEACNPRAGVRPIIDARHCEGAGDCIEVCPYDGFEVRKLTAAERGALPLRARLKVFVHGGKQGFVVRGDDCQICGLCVRACPEHAIRLSR